MPENAVEITDLVKRYEGRAVVDGLTMSVRRGEILAFVGPNGAGKTTTVEIVEGLRVPDAGSVRVLGVDPRRDRGALRPRMGVMLQRGELQSQIEVREAVQLFAAFYPRPLDAAELLVRLGLAPLAQRRYRALSGGERQRVNLALALVGRPAIAILDEPTAAMDAASRRMCWDVLHELRATGATVLLTTHLIDEAEVLADRVAIIHRGRLLALGTPAEVTASSAGLAPGEREVRLRLRDGSGADAADQLARLPGVLGVRVDRPDTYVMRTSAAPALLMDLTAWSWTTGREVLEIHVGGGSLEDTFTRLTAGDAGQVGAHSTGGSDVSGTAAALPGPADDGARVRAVSPPGHAGPQ